MPTPQTSKRMLRTCGWVVLGGLLVWLAAEDVAALKPRPTDAGRQPSGDPPAVAGMDLKAMLARAERQHPAVRAAEAKLAAARAELDRTRLQAANEVIEARKQWRAARAVVVTAEAELDAAESGGRNPQLIKAANERRKFAREQMTAAEVRLALLVGKDAADGKKAPDRSQRDKVLRKLRAIAQGMVKVATADWRVGKTDPAQLFAATRRLGRIDVELARTKADKLKAIDDYVKTLEELQKIAVARYKAGRGSQADVLAVRYAITEAGLWKLDVK